MGAFESLGEFYGSFMRVLGVLIELRSLRSFLVDSGLKELWEFLGVLESFESFLGVLGVLRVLIELRSLRSFLVDLELKNLWEFWGVFGSSREF